MGVTEAEKIKISNRSGSSGKSAFFQILDSGRLWGPLDDLDQKKPRQWPPLKFDFEGVCLLPWVPNFEIGEPYFLAGHFFPWIRPNFFIGQKITPWRINLSLKKYTFCDNWTKIVGQSWFGALTPELQD